MFNILLNMVLILLFPCCTIDLIEKKSCSMWFLYAETVQKIYKNDKYIHVVPCRNTGARTINLCNTKGFFPEFYKHLRGFSEIKWLTSPPSSCSRNRVGVKYFSREDGLQNYFVFQSLIKYFKSLTNNAVRRGNLKICQIKVLNLLLYWIIVLIKYYIILKILNFEQNLIKVA